METTHENLEQRTEEQKTEDIVDTVIARSEATKQSSDNSHEEEVQDEITAEEINVEPEILEPSTLSGIASALKSDLKAQVEAVLFVSDTPLKTGAISKMLNASYDDIQSALVQLIQEYEDRNGGLEIGTDDGYIIQVKTQYLNIVTDMMPLELNPGPMRTLSAIALKEPVLQSEVIDMRGSGAYDHINELVEQELITKKPQGLTYVLKTTGKFQQYFRLTQDANKIKDRLQEQAIKRAKEKERQKEQEALVSTIPEAVAE
ncbi:MAG: SMC-Scp complex subunit ScpB [Candidatus Melainabacteria bacterium RIFCSPLOWO2_02_FULL_35_15]|nr:MAG: SMC-Scp complex subunit ScpB [Candidatus Melainabacteria bacterium RIFCSPLOWO2_12_FULL_35_11]OGI13874.1 MAG: SMC-Scp complex subunit ScpB [Candidatus Melainabacteria bacterium RIFCSPLOWO2_02_FULL_35_15]